MSIAFSSKLVACRHAKGVTQKEAAAAMGITSALLSHYENGIRECKIDMIPRIASYYGVTADYLIGCSESRHGAGEFFDMDYLNGDEGVSVKTVIRSVIGLSQLSSDVEGKTDDFFCDFFSLCVKKYTDAVAGNSDVRAKFINQALDGLVPDVEMSVPCGDEPMCVKTVISNADYIIDGALADIIGKH